MEPRPGQLLPARRLLTPACPPESPVQPTPLPTTEVHLDVEAVRRLVAAHFPKWRELPITEAPFTGTQNTLYLLGSEFCVRLPRRTRVAARLEKEVRWLPVIGRYSRLEVPTVEAAAPPGPAYPMPWAVYRWIPAERLVAEKIADERDAALRLGAFVAQLRCIDPRNGPPSQQDRPMSERDRDVRSALSVIGDVVNRSAVWRAWQRLLAAPSWHGRPTWTHGDLLPPNLLLRNDRLVGVVDFGCAGVGDPAVDLIAAWSIFGSSARDVFRGAVGADDDAWARGRAFALHQAVVIAAAHHATPGPMLAVAARTAAAVIADCDRRYP